MNNDIVNIISPTGCIHRADKYEKNLYQPICNVNNGPYASEYLKDWPETKDLVTCKNCLRMEGKLEPVSFPHKYFPYRYAEVMKSINRDVEDLLTKEYHWSDNINGFLVDSIKLIIRMLYVILTKK